MALYLPKQDVPFVDPNTGKVDKTWYGFLSQLNTALSAVAAIVDGLAFDDIDGTISLAQLVAHAANHKTGGSDAIKLDELAATTDNTNLNASTGAHGLLPKLSGNAAHRLNGLGQWV